MKLNDNKYSKIIFKRIGKKILIFTAIFTVFFIFMLVVSLIIANSLIWQPDDPLYIFLISVRSNLLFIWALGILFIIVFYLKKSLSYIDYVIQASEDLLDKNNNYISLPSDLSMLEKHLNQIKQESIRNEILAKTNEERKNELIVYLAHDLKTPLTSIIGYLELLNESPDLPVSYRAKYANITLNKAYRLEELINEFFEIARFNVGNIVLNKSSINLRLMLEQIIDEFYPLSKSQDKEIVINCPTFLCLVADSDKLSRVFNNVLKNAIAYSFPNSKININVKENLHDVSIEISNSGTTIPQDKLDYIFEKFYRLDESRGSNSGGAGLGLAIAKEIVEAHGGKIFASSQNNVTTFTIELQK